MKSLFVPMSIGHTVELHPYGDRGIPNKNTGEQKKTSRQKGEWVIRKPKEGNKTAGSYNIDRLKKLYKKVAQKQTERVASGACHTR
jgi:hypothetical protein